MAVVVKLLGVHPRIEKISSIKAIRRTWTINDLGESKKLLERALDGQECHFEVANEVIAQDVANELATLGAIVEVEGNVFDSYRGEERLIPYRRHAVGTLLLSRRSQDEYEGTISSGICPQKFSLSLPLNSSLDLRVEAICLHRKSDNIVVKTVFSNSEESELWNDIIGDEIFEGDAHELGEQDAAHKSDPRAG